MANYNIVVGSKFKPFSYEEILQPLQMATIAHQDIENQYTELATKANVWEEMADAQSDPYAYSMYKSYSNDLAKQAEILAREGLTPISRQNMLNMKARYSSDIIPIEQAYKRRQELVDEQRKLSAQDNTLMYDKLASSLSLDDLIKNPQLSYQSYSGATLAKQVGTAASNMAKEMRDNPRKWRSILGNQYYETMMQTGFNSEAVLDAIQNNPGAAQELTNLVEDTISSSGIRDWNDTNTLSRAYDYARQGLWNAVGETKYQTLANRDFEENPRPPKTPADRVEQSRLPDITSYFFERDREILPEILDENGKLKTSLSKWGVSARYKLDDKLFQNGKFTKPNIVSPDANENIEATSYYNKINDILLDHGYSQSAINKMDKKTIESNLKNIQEFNKNDALGRNVYRFSLDNNASKFLSSKLKGRGVKMKEIVSMKDGIPKYGDSTELNIEEGGSVDVLYDPGINNFIVLNAGEYYELPKGMLSNDIYTQLNSYSQEGTQAKIKEAQQLRDYLSTKSYLSDRELQALDAANNFLLYWDDVMGTVGDKFMEYVGTSKIN